MIIASNSYYQVFPDLERYPDQWFLHEARTADGQEIEPIDLTDGLFYTGPAPVMVPVGNPGRELAFNLAALDMPVVSSTVAAIIRRVAPDDVQLFPVQVPGAAGQYEVLNVVRRADCLDEARSEFTMCADEDPEQAGLYDMISTIRVDPARIDGYHLFRIARWTLALLVSETIKTALADVPELGVRFDLVV